MRGDRNAVNISWRCHSGLRYVTERGVSESVCLPHQSCKFRLDTCRPRWTTSQDLPIRYYDHQESCDVWTFDFFQHVTLHKPYVREKRNPDPEQIAGEL